MAGHMGFSRDKAYATRADISEANALYGDFVREATSAAEENTTAKWSDHPSCAQFAAEVQRSFLLVQDHMVQAQGLSDQGSQRIRGLIGDVDAIEFDLQDAFASAAESLLGVGRSFGDSGNPSEDEDETPWKKPPKDG